MSKHYQHLENIIRSEFIPALTGNPPPNDSDRDLFALPAKVGCLGLRNPTKSSDQEYTASRTITKSLVDAITNHHGEYSYECITSQMEAKADIRWLGHQQTSQEAENLKCILPTVRHRAMELASEKGASNWLTVLPIEEYGFCLHKGDALSLRYIWTRTAVFSACEHARMESRRGKGKKILPPTFHTRAHAHTRKIRLARDYIYIFSLALAAPQICTFEEMAQGKILFMA